MSYVKLVNKVLYDNLKSLNNLLGNCEFDLYITFNLIIY